MRVSGTAAKNESPQIHLRVVDLLRAIGERHRLQRFVDLDYRNERRKLCDIQIRIRAAVCRI